MGDCYAWGISYKIQDEKRAAAIKELSDYVREHHGKDCRFHEESVTEENLGSLEGLIKLFNAGHQQFTDGIWEQDDYCGHNALQKFDDKGFRHMSGACDCSYRWGNIMEEFFNILAKYLEDGSTYWVDADETKLDLVVENGEAIENPE